MKLDNKHAWKKKKKTNTVYANNQLNIAAVHDGQVSAKPTLRGRGDKITGFSPIW